MNDKRLTYSISNATELYPDEGRAIKRIIISMRVFLGLVIVMFLFFHISPEVQMWCSDRWQGVERATSLKDLINETDYIIPEKGRKPEESVAEFHKNIEEKTIQLMVDSRLRFPKQYHEGSILMGGYHSTMPPNSRWKNGVVSIGSHEKHAYDLAYEQEK